ncbi:hypothetical protein [Streptomyces sp. S186]|uniref:hypothetical protein n=1 Tax=Streptomyces sp. S186 TaxID=3434395 RepID=UPI003F67A61B
MSTGPGSARSSAGTGGFDLGNVRGLGDLLGGFGSGMVGLGPYGLAPFRDFGSMLDWF